MQPFAEAVSRVLPGTPAPDSTDSWLLLLFVRKPLSRFPFAFFRLRTAVLKAQEVRGVRHISQLTELLLNFIFVKNLICICVAKAISNLIVKFDTRS